MNEKMFINVSGFITSGSSAVVDLLKEFDGTYECEAEIRIIRDPYGICDLESAVVENWQLINSTAAVFDFLEMCKKCSRTGGGKIPWARFGLSYNKTISKDFMEITKKYVDELTSYTYLADFYHIKSKKRYYKYVIDRCRAGLDKVTDGKIKPSKKNIPKCYFIKPTQEQFNIATQNYFEELYSEQFKIGKYIILDQAVSPNNPTVIHRYFKNAKMIVVDRDPRDMFIDDIFNWGERFFDDMHTKESGYKYALRQKALRGNRIDDPDILYVRFEDVILKYEETTKKIMDFLGFSEKDHVRKREFLQVERSSKNVGIWKAKYEEYKEAIDAIVAEVPELCYNEQ